MFELTVIRFSHFCVSELPLPSESVDTIISDIPFGKKFKLGKDIKHIIQEMERWAVEFISTIFELLAI